MFSAPLSQVYDTVRDFTTWPTWSPWLIGEPDCEVKQGSDGEGFSWDGEIIGQGEMDIVNEEKEKNINYHLSLLKPWKSLSDVSFTFIEKGGSTEVTWTMNGSVPFYLFFLKPMMTCMIGMDYHRGLLMLKAYVETGAVPSSLDFKDSHFVKGCEYIGIKTVCSFDDLGSRMQADFEKLTDYLSSSDHQISGKAFTIYEDWKMGKAEATYICAFPIEKIPTDLAEGYVSGKREDTDAYTVIHTGPYDYLGNAWSAGMSRSRSGVFEQNGKLKPFEIYETAPDHPEPVTHVHFPKR